MKTTNLPFYIFLIGAIALFGWVVFYNPGSGNPSDLTINPQYSTLNSSSSNLTLNTKSLALDCDFDSSSDYEHSKLGSNLDSHVWSDGWSEQGSESGGISYTSSSLSADSFIASSDHSTFNTQQTTLDSGSAPADSSSNSSQGGGSAGGGGADSGSSSGSSDSSAGDILPPASHPSGGGGQSRTDCSVVVVSSCERYLQDEYLISGKQTAEIFCAKNETESFQMIVCNASGAVLPDIEIHISSFEPQGRADRMPVMTVYREHYVDLKKASASYSNNPILSRPGMYPDALIPFLDPYTHRPITNAKYLANHQSVLPRTSQGYWVDVKVGADVPAGTYTCSILITSSNTPIAEIPVTLTVWDFTLPAKREWTAWFSMIRNLGLIYGLPENKGPDYDLLMSRHQDMLYEHGVYPTLQAPLYPIVDTKTGAVTFDGYNKFLPRFIEFVKKYGPGVYRILDHFPDEFDSNGNNPKLARTLSDFHQFQTKHPGMGQFFYIIDEPYSDEAGRKVINVGRIIDKVAPSIKLLVNGAWFIYYKDPAVTEEAVEAVIDIRSVYSFDHLSTPKQIQKVREFVDAGKHVWICQGTLLDHPILHHRVPTWRGYCLGISGQLEWRTSVSDVAMDPWVDPVTYIDKSGKKYNGEGLFIYQGKPDEVGLSNPGGPIASMRLKVFRDAVEDYAYFKLAESAASRQAVVEQIEPLAPDFKTHRSPSEYQDARKRIAELILKN